VRLSAFAIERDVEVVVLSHADYSGLERFGFRTERISGSSQAARHACERQVAGFWRLEVII
jgi:chorismate synthase